MPCPADDCPMRRTSMGGPAVLAGCVLLAGACINPVDHGRPNARDAAADLAADLRSSDASTGTGGAAPGTGGAAPGTGGAAPAGTGGSTPAPDAAPEVSSPDLTTSSLDTRPADQSSADNRPVDNRPVTPDASAPDSAPGGDPPAGWIPAIVGVGYGGVRIRSTDLGQSWQNEVRLSTGYVDDENLLRAVAYGKGLWGAVGFQYFTSSDGITWTKRTHPCGTGIASGLAYGAGIFIATCLNGTGMSFLSNDGLTWRQGGGYDVGGHPRVIYGGGRFALTGDNRTVYTSNDGMAWTVWPGMTDAAVCDGTIKSVAACGGAAFRTQGVWLLGWLPAQGGSGIFRSTNGTTYTRVHTTGIEAFAAGFVPP